MSLFGLNFLQIGSWIRRQDQTVVQSLWQDWEAHDSAFLCPVTLAALMLSAWGQVGGCSNSVISLSSIAGTP